MSGACSRSPDDGGRTVHAATDFAMNAVGSAVADGVTSTIDNAPEIGTAASIVRHLDSLPGSTGSNGHCHGCDRQHLDRRFLRSIHPPGPLRGRKAHRLSLRRSLLHSPRHQLLLPPSGMARVAASTTFSFTPIAGPLSHYDLNL